MTGGAPVDVYPVLVVLVMTVHALVILFNVGGEAAIVAGGLLGWRWVRSPAFRVTHLGIIAAVVVTTLAGESCSLTALENWLRAQAHLATYSGGFIEHWLGRILYLQAPAWAFVVAYTVFGVLVVATWWLVPPAWVHKTHRAGTPDR